MTLVKTSQCQHTHWRKNLPRANLSFNLSFSAPAFILGYRWLSTLLLLPVLTFGVRQQALFTYLVEGFPCLVTFHPHCYCADLSYLMQCYLGPPGEREKTDVSLHQTTFLTWGKWLLLQLRLLYLSHIMRRQSRQ